MIGANVSAVGGLVNAFNQADEWGLESCQFYVKPSRSWKGEMVSDDLVRAFKERRLKSSIKSILGHSALIHNLAGEEEVRKKSVKGVRLELNIAGALGIEQLVVHSGYGPLGRLRKSIDEIMSGYTGGTRLLLEVSSGQKGSRGANIEELVAITEEFKTGKTGICLDTCHLFAAGYDISDPEVTGEIFEKVGRFLGAIHLNDSRGNLGSHLDRHEHIGKGQIGAKGFKNIFEELRRFNIPKILETPERDTMTVQNLSVVRRLAVHK